MAPQPHAQAEQPRHEEWEQESAYGRRRTSFQRYPNHYRAVFGHRGFTSITEVARALRITPEDVLHVVRTSFKGDSATF